MIDMFYSHCSFKCNRHDQKKMKNTNLSIFVLRTHTCIIIGGCDAIASVDLICSKSINIYFFTLQTNIVIFIFIATAISMVYPEPEPDSPMLQCNNWLCIWVNGKTLKIHIRNKNQSAHFFLCLLLLVLLLLMLLVLL